MKSFLFLLFISTFAFQSVNANSISTFSDNETELFVVITTGDAETQMMALILATQSLNQNVSVRILLCSDGGDLALKESDSPTFKPANRSPKDLLLGLMNNGAKVEVCGIYLPNRKHLTPDDLHENIGTASPPEVAAYMKSPNIRYFTF